MEEQIYVRWKKRLMNFQCSSKLSKKAEMRCFSNDEMYHPEEKHILVYILYLNNLKYTQHEEMFNSEALHTECVIVNINGLDK